jgi:hypothetical protein
MEQRNPNSRIVPVVLVILAIAAVSLVGIALYVIVTS